jgi:CheY-like chemotaxis protein
MSLKKHHNDHTRIVLLVDDNDDYRLLTKWLLGSFDYEVDSVGCAEEALQLFDPKIHDVVITDNSMPGMSGAEMAHIIKLRSPSTPVVMYSGHPPSDHSCLDLVIQRPVNFAAVKDGLDRIFAAIRP